MSPSVASIRYLVPPPSGRSYRCSLGRNGATARALAPQVAIGSLGAFRLFRDGVPVPATAWQSKKARTLLKILVARRGRSTPRELLDRRRRADPLDDLTSREREVLGLMAEGLTDRGIAQRLYVTPKTVETHTRHIFQKLNLPESALENKRVHAVLTYLRP